MKYVHVLYMRALFCHLISLKGFDEYKSHFESTLHRFFVRFFLSVFFFLFSLSAEDVG